MRQPRSKQRFPRGGEQLYELLKSDHEPVLIWCRRADQTDDEHLRLHAPDMLVYDHEADPMIYFWPVEGQMVTCQFDSAPEEASKKRLVKALLRDGAMWVAVVWQGPAGVSSEWENHGEPAAFMLQHGYETLSL